MYGANDEIDDLRAKLADCERKRDEALVRLERAVGFREGHPTMCCGACHDKIAAAEAERDAEKWNAQQREMERALTQAKLEDAISDCTRMMGERDALRDGLQRLWALIRVNALDSNGDGWYDGDPYPAWALDGLSETDALLAPKPDTGGGMALDREKVRDALLPHMALFHSINVPLGLQDAVLALVAREVAAAVEAERTRCVECAPVWGPFRIVNEPASGDVSTPETRAYWMGVEDMRSAIRAPQPDAGSGE